MIELIGQLSGTPLPTILVVAGLLFLFVGLGGRFTANIVTDKVNAKLASFVGAVLLLMGVIISMAPLAIPTTSDNDPNIPVTAPMDATKATLPPTADISVPVNKIVVGQSMKFMQGAMTCHNLESITKYHVYLESGNKQKINELLGTGWCGYSVVPRLDIVVLEVDDQFMKVKGTFMGQTSIVWIKGKELIK